MKKKRQVTGIRYRYTQSSEYRVYAANGAWGGVCANGNIQADFYMERQFPPKELAYTIVGNALANEERVPTPGAEQIVERQVQFGLLITPEAARAIGNWLIGKADEYEQVIASADEDSEEDADITEGELSNVNGS